VAGVRAPLDVLYGDVAALRDHLLDLRANLDRPVGDLEILQRSSDVLERQPEERPRLAVGEQQQAIDADEDLRKRSGFVRCLAYVDSLLARRVRGRAPDIDATGVAAPEPGDLSEHPAVQVDPRGD